MDTQACCSHSRITRITENHPPGFTTEYWKCETCETRFCPEPLMQGRVLRDWFAGMALAGTSAIPDDRICPKARLNEIEKWRQEMYDFDAENAYRSADAMIAQREKKS